MAGNTEFTDFVTATLDAYTGQFVDNIFDDYPLMAKFIEANGVTEYEGGGNRIIEELMYKKNGTFGSFSGYDTLDITPQEGLTAAAYDWKQGAVSITFNGREKALNEGPHQNIGLVKSRIEQAELSAREGFNTMFWSDGTGNAGKDFLGLGALIGDETSAITDIGGIDCALAGNEFWRSTVRDVSLDASTVRSTGIWTNVVNTAGKGADAFDFGITTQELFEHYEASLEPNMRYTSDKGADAKFENITFKQRPLFYDDMCPTGETIFPNSRYVKLKRHPKVWGAKTPWKDVPDKDAFYMQMLFMGELVTSNRARQARVEGQTVA